MKITDKIHDNIDDDIVADRIMKEFAMRWFGFGLGVGITVTCVFFGIFNLINL